MKYSISYIQFLLLILLFNDIWLISSVSYDLPNERPDSFHTMPISVFNKKFHVGSVHHDWVLHEEFQCLEEVNRALKDKEGQCNVLDVGMNDGFYTQLSASYGCRVWSFELQESCITVSRNAIHVNNFTDLVTIFRSPVSNSHSEVFKVPRGSDDDVKRCDGGFSISGKDPNQKAHKQFQVHGHIALHTTKLDSFVPWGTIIDFMKVDVEGHDVEVLMGAEKLFKEHRIKMALIEVTSEFWGVAVNEGLEIYKKIIENYGYQVICIGDPARAPDKNVFRSDLNYESFAGFVKANKCVNWKFTPSRQ